MEYQILLLITIFIAFLLLGILMNRKTISKSKEDKIYLIIILSYMIVMLILDHIIARRFAIASFGGLQIGWITKEILKRKKA